MELYRGNLACRDQTLDTIDLDVGFAIAFNGDERKQVRHPCIACRWKKRCAIDAVRGADDGAGSAAQMLDHPRADLFEVAGEIVLGEAS